MVDLKKAFDKVRIKNIIRVLCDREIPFDIIKINENIYGNDITEARIDGQLTDPINIGTGIREREKLLKLLIQFNNGWNNKKMLMQGGYRMGEIKILYYADVQWK